MTHYRSPDEFGSPACYPRRWSSAVPLQQRIETSLHSKGCSQHTMDRRPDLWFANAQETSQNDRDPLGKVHSRALRFHPLISGPRCRQRGSVISVIGFQMQWKASRCHCDLQKCTSGVVSRERPESRIENRTAADSGIEAILSGVVREWKYP